MTCVNQPNFKAVLGDFTLCEKMAAFDNKRYQELHPKQQKTKEPKVKQEKKPKEEKKEEKPAAAAVAAPPKKKDHFANVPATEFNMEAWKRFYSNNDAEKFNPYLWENFDPAAWSWWHADYNYNHECKVDFMTMNLIGGMYQRLDGCRKHLFGVNLMFKEKTDGVDHFSLSGVWFQRGQEQIFTMGEEDGWNYDAEQFTLRKLDPIANAEDKNCVESYLNWEGDYLKGREIEDGMSFK
jgi:elongation factor 1-gamma